MTLFAACQSFLKRYHGRGRARLRKFNTTSILSNFHYFKLDYAGNAQIWACPRHWVGECILKDGAYEPFTCSIIERFVAEGFSFIDVGANIGTHTIVAGRARSGSQAQRIIAFEPFERSYKVLLENCRLNDLQNIECQMAAVSDQSGEGYLFEPEPDPGRVMTFAATPPADAASASPCQFVCLDDFLSEPAMIRPTLVKIDVQGAEPRVLRGAIKSLGQLPELTIIFEIDIPWLTKAGFTLHDMIAALEPYQFEKFYALFERRREYQQCTLATLEGLLAQQRSYINFLAIKGNIAETIVQKIPAPVRDLSGRTST